ncbi:YqfQ family protein [Fictibacillus phosphorivorans]|nr:YqfQ family protein [Fictibacillus phosphorivorans]MCM3716848.1 YqfQ family protein [Fictibacillus phosphorivorans]MCM3774603.1 YqfQ family protein [Fictibacillus phosphorivorans]
MQPFYRYPTQPQHPMQPFQVHPHMQNMNGMQGMPRHAGSVDRFLGTIGSGGSVTGGTSIFTMLNNVQKVLKVAETMGPMIKQYGPAMKNLPSIMTAFKEFQNGGLGSGTKAENSPEADTSKKVETTEANKTDETNETNENNSENAEVKENKGPKKKGKNKKEVEEKVKVTGKKSSKKAKTKTAKEQVQQLKKAPANTKLVPAAPKTNMPKGYHLSGPKLYV